MMESKVVWCPQVPPQVGPGLDLGNERTEPKLIAFSAPMPEDLHRRSHSRLLTSDLASDEVASAEGTGDIFTHIHAQTRLPFGGVSTSPTHISVRKLSRTPSFPGPPSFPQNLHRHQQSPARSTPSLLPAPWPP